MASISIFMVKGRATSRSSRHRPRSCYSWLEKQQEASFAKDVRARLTEPPSYESELKTTAYFDTPDNCIRRIANLKKEHNIDYFGASMSFGSMKHDKVMRSMELFAKKVMPKFR